MESDRQSQNTEALTRSIAPRKVKILPRLSSLSSFLPDRWDQAKSTSKKHLTGNYCCPLTTSTKEEHPPKEAGKEKAAMLTAAW